MTDIFQEVEEDVRRERLDALWKQYGEYVFLGMALIVLAIAGWQFWKFYHAREVIRASDAYTSAEIKAGSGDTQAAAAEFARLAREAPSGYASISRLQQANALLAGGNTADAVNIYKTIESGSDPSLAAVARLRHAWAIADFASRDNVAQIVAPLVETSSAWKYAAREVLAYADYHNGATAKAADEFGALARDSQASQVMRQRAQIMASFLASGAGRDVGSVPPPPAPAASAADNSPNNDGTPKP